MRTLLLALFVLFAPLLVCCTTWTEVASPWTEATVAKEARVQVTLDDGVVHVLKRPAIVRHGASVCLRGELGAGKTFIGIARIERLCVERPDVLGNTILSVLTTALVLTGFGILVGEAIEDAFAY